ncbi:MAG TPA: polymer-forming cytoskeletal protein, partial [Candidatus Edwardsbacteria bacterium]|nr:polymer-forming cytoskeletal protein [Candidatus Edwardsbacteria bacterium]
MSKSLFVFLAAALLLASPLLALTMRSGDQITVAKGEVIDDDLFAAGSKVTIDGTVNGDVFAFAGDVVIRGKIKGELFAFAGTVVTADTVAGPVRAFAGEVNNSGFVAGNFTAFCGRLKQDGVLGRDATIKCGQAQIGGIIGRDLGLEAKNAEVSGAVGRDAYLRARNLDLSKLAVGRDLVYKTPSQFALPAGVTAAGKTDWLQLPVEREHHARGLLRAIRVFFRWIWFIGLLAIGMILLAVMPRHSLAIADAINGSFWKSLGIGALWLVLAPVAIVIVGLTIVGLPLAVFGLWMYLTSLYLAAFGFSLLLGRKIFDLLKKPAISRYWAFLAGLCVLFVVTLIPLLGFAVRLFVMALGGGALL